MATYTEEESRARRWVARERRVYETVRDLSRRQGGVVPDEPPTEARERGKNLHFMVTHELYDRMADLAYEMGISRGELMNRAIEGFLEKYNA